MKILRIIVGYLLLSGIHLQAATTSSPQKPFDWGLNGITTPLEEYGLTLGDITVTRVFNPIGQLQAEDPIVIARRLNHITNPWEELTPGTGLMVDGEKAVILQIQPEKEPSEKFPDSKTNLRVKLTAEKISGGEITLEWDQILHNLNSSETKSEREETVDLLKKRLRVGTHLIINGGRRIISKHNLSYNPPSSQRNRDLQLKADYYTLEKDTGTLTGHPSSSENITDSAWNLKEGEINLQKNTAQLVEWKFLGSGDDPGKVPVITILHRSHGIVSKIHLPNGRLAEARIESTRKGNIHTHKLKWEQLIDDKGASSWQLKDSRDDFIELFKVNDDNIRFKIAPNALKRANRNAIEFLQGEKENTGKLNMSSKILDLNTITYQINNLREIIDSDASEAVKLDAKRQAVIYLARFYEHKATELQAFRQEQIFRAKMKREEARKYERHAWLTNHKIELLKKSSKEKSVQLKEEADPPRPNDLLVGSLNISIAHDKLNDYDAKIIPALSEDKLQIEFSSLLRKNMAFNKESNRLRDQAEKLTANGNKKGASEKDPVIENYNLALHFWSEYIYRTEGLNRGTRQLDNTGIENNNSPLKATGIGSNTPAPDPYLPEILLRQAWIHRQAGSSKRAVSAYYDVLTGATKQKINNLVRFSRIALVARSQIANTHWEDAENRENINEAIDLYTRLLQSDGEKLDDEKELDSSQVQLKLLRALFKSDEYARIEIRRKKRELAELNGSNASQNPDSPTTYLTQDLLEKEKNRVLSEIAVIKQEQTKNWMLMKKHADQYIEAKEEPNLRYDGEIRYYIIAANKALGNPLHVQKHLKILLDRSTPPEFQQAWLATRVRILIDVANLLYSEAVETQAAATALSRFNSLTTPSTENLTKTKHALPQNLRMAINGYEQALEFDQSYRSQIMLRQQIAWCQERLDRKEEAKGTYEKIINLCKMHPQDLNATLKVVQYMANIKYNGLNQELDQKSNALK